MRIKTLLAALGLISSVAGTVTAHHAITTHFDPKKPIELDGVVTEMRVVNPHSYLYFDVTGTDGNIEKWRCEMYSGTGLRRRGWTSETVKSGQGVHVSGTLARREANLCLLDTALLDNGLEISSTSVLGETTIVSAKETNDPLVEPAVTMAGKPNLSGYWIRKVREGIPVNDGVPLFGGPAIMRPIGIKPTEVGIAASKGFEFVYDAPAVHCHPTNILYGMIHDVHANRISHSVSSMAMTYGYMDLDREVDLQLRAHPDEVAPSTAGHSIGYWEDDVFVVDTIGFEPGYLLAGPNGAISHGSEMKIVERFWLSEDRNRLMRSYEATDPEYFTGVFRGKDEFNRSGEPYIPYNCTELSGKSTKRTEKEE
jgi:hypothetical protein